MYSKAQRLETYARFVRSGHYQQLITMNAADRTRTDVALVIGYTAPEEPGAMDVDMSELTRSARGLAAGMLTSGVRAEPCASAQTALSRSAPAAPAARAAGTERAVVAQIAGAHADAAAPTPAPGAPKKKQMRDGRKKPVARSAAAANTPP